MKPISVRPIPVRTCAEPAYAEEDWKHSLLPLAGIAQDRRAFHIDTCVPPAYADAIAVDAFPSDIVVEGVRGGQIERFTRLHLPVPIDPGGVHALMRGIHLEIIAPKAA
jgi:hypothetical protein